MPQYHPTQAEPRQLPAQSVDLGDRVEMDDNVAHLSRHISKRHLEFVNVSWEPNDMKAPDLNELLDRAGGWVPDEQTSICFGCSRGFETTRRKHHCRRCGLIFCDDCSLENETLTSFEEVLPNVLANDIGGNPSEYIVTVVAESGEFMVTVLYDNPQGIDEKTIQATLEDDDSELANKASVSQMDVSTALYVTADDTVDEDLTNQIEDLEASVTVLGVLLGCIFAAFVVVGALVVHINFKLQRIEKVTPPSHLTLPS